MIFIRTDSNSEIATGHMMRCLTIARGLKENGKRVEFLISDDASVLLLKKSPFKYRVLNTEWNNLDRNLEIDAMKKILLREENPVLIVDSYFASNVYYKELRPYAKLVIFDDFYKEKYDVDLLINYSIFHNMYDYELRYAGTETITLIGPAFIPLREQFARDRKKRKFNKNRLDILVMSGGGDKYNVLSTLMLYGQEKEEFSKFRADFHVVVGAYNTNIDKLRGVESLFPEVMIYENVEDIAGMMEKCDILVSSASTVLYEACAMGIPTIFFCMSDDQVNDIKYFSEEAGFIYVGDVRYEKDFDKRIFEAIGCLMDKEDLRRDISEKSQKIVDGLGTNRIVEEICYL